MAGHLDEPCQECGKTISRRAIANLVDGRVVCTGCKHKIERAKELAAHPPPQLPEYDPEAPTERQIAFAERLGVPVPSTITKWELSELIDRAKAAREADELTAAMSVASRRVAAVSGIGIRPGAAFLWGIAVGALIVLLLVIAWSELFGRR